LLFLFQGTDLAMATLSDDSDEIVLDPVPVTMQPQFAPMPVSTDDIRDLYQTPEELDEYYSLGLGVFRWSRDKMYSPKLLAHKKDDRRVCFISQ